jgi:hypothetical protein
MSEHHEKASFIDRFWPLGLILFGAAFIAALVFFKPHF